MEAGRAASNSRVKVVCPRTFWTSTTGVARVTVTVSSTAPTVSTASTAAVNPAFNSMPSRTSVLKPGKVKVTV